MQEQTKNLKPSLEKKQEWKKMKEYNIHVNCHLFFNLQNKREQQICKLFNKFSFLEISTMNFFVSNPQKTFYWSKALFV